MPGGAVQIARVERSGRARYGLANAIRVVGRRVFGLDQSEQRPDAKLNCGLTEVDTSGSITRKDKVTRTSKQPTRPKTARQ